MSVPVLSRSARLSPAPVDPLRKRVLDLVLAGAALVLLVPLLLVVALVVRLDSPGPVLFRQVRVGRDGVPFTICKFRTMVDGADRLGANVSPVDDPRITRVGRLLRHWYLDETPQLVNVLRGDMSLVGPRPETPEFVALYGPVGRRLLEARPGLVGPSTLAGMGEEALLAASAAPVELYRSTVLPARVAADLGYLEGWTLRRDVRLLVQQALAIVRRRP